MHFNTSLANAKLNQTLLLDAVGLCYVIAPPHRALNGDPGLAKDQYKNKYWADRLLRTHCSTWGYQFNLYRLYHQLCPSPLQHHKSKDEIIDELSNRMAHGEFLVFCVDNLLPSPPDATNADVPMASSNMVEQLQPIVPSRNLEQGGKDLTNNDKLEVLDISCSLPNGKPAVNIPYTVKSLSCGTVHKGELDNSGTQHFDNLQAGDVEVIFGKPITEAEIVTTRNQIGFLLESIIAAQNAEALALETEYQELNSAEKWLKRVEQRARGVFDAGAGTLESIATNYSINSMLAYLTRIYIAAWRTNDTVTDNWVTTFADNYLEQHHKELVIALGFDPAAINKEMFAEAYEVASFVNSDPATQNALIDFAKDYVAAQHELEWNYIAGSAIFEIVLTALLASSTGGIGAAGSVPSKARHINKFSELGTLLKQLTKQLKQKAQFKQKRGRTNGHITHQIKRPDGAELPNNIRPISTTIATRKRVPPTSLSDAKERLLSMAKIIADEGYQPKYTDAELIAMAKTGNVAKERFHVRFMESEYINGGEGMLGAQMEGKTGKGAKYWSTTFDQIEDADTDFKLIANKLGLGDSFDPQKKYTLIIIDTEKSKDLTGVKSISATFENLSKFANEELPADFPKEITDRIMNSNFQDIYAKHYTAANSLDYLEWYSDPIGFNNYLSDTKLTQDTKDYLLKRLIMQRDIGNNKDYTGNGLTMNLIENSSNKYGAVETLNFERKMINLNQLQQANAITYITK
ncbi:hypothetical protein [Photobacterium proteolyticum]|nr:hypothetical protein [Photobacterium proteolyticum]